MMMNCRVCGKGNGLHVAPERRCRCNEDRRPTFEALPPVTDEPQLDYTPRQTFWDSMSDAEIVAYARKE